MAHNIPMARPRNVLRWMVFVDGENLSIRGQELCGKNDIPVDEKNEHMRDVLLWPRNIACRHATKWSIPNWMMEQAAVRSHYYTSVVGASRIHEVEDRLKALNFEPCVFQKNKQGKTKGVDISLARDMLCHAFRDNYDMAVLVAGDRDFVPLVEEVKRLGKIVVVAFIGADRGGLSRELRVSSDWFWPIDNYIIGPN
jgi:uncharacterized LabA/DUF88 family protein